ncbi:hypothetical protein FS749_004871 [Ceratobasidium sp. UAMH 11750]|nr:hypothetical protein FS749_004871 [Ceratobasidium sp. UAMH 11750]
MDTLNSVMGVNHPVVFQEITVAVLVDSFDPDDAEPSNALRLHLPNSQILRCLHLEQVAPSLNHLAHVSPLPLLQELDLKRIYIELGTLLFPLLSLVPNLVKLSLDSCYFWLGSKYSSIAHLERSVLLPKLEKLSLRKILSLYPLDELFRILDLPNLRKFKFGVGRFAWDTSVWSIDWGAVFHNHTLEKLKLEGLKPKILEDLVTHIDKLDNLKELEILPDDFYGWVDFPFEFAGQLLGTSCCPML